MVLNQQRRIAVDLDAARGFVRKVRTALRLGRRQFNVCFVDDARIAELNGRYRKKLRPTDVLSFPWPGALAAVGARPGNVGDRGKVAASRRAGPSYSKTSGHRPPLQQGEFASFLGDVVISTETARRNARAAGHSTAREIRWLILHGALHLLGYDHETDRGEMTALEFALRERLCSGKR
jgi:rRNA maturation RNase YbeY